MQATKPNKIGNRNNQQKILSSINDSIRKTKRHTQWTNTDQVLHWFESFIWSPCKIKDINAIEQIQRRFTYKIEGLKNLNYWERLDKLNLMSLQRCRERNIILHLWKIRNKVYPNTINIEFKEHKRSSAISIKSRNTEFSSFSGSINIKISFNFHI